MLDNYQDGELLETKATCEFIVWKSDNSAFKIAKFKNSPKKQPSKFTLVGDMHIEVGMQYYIKGVEDKKSKYANTYRLLSFSTFGNLLEASADEQKLFVSQIATKAIADDMFDKLENPIKSISEGDIQTLVQIDGLGEKRAQRLIERYYNEIDYSDAYIRLKDYNISQRQIKSIVMKYGGVSNAVNAILENPYCLTSLSGYGFRKADAIFCSNKNNKLNDIRRVHAYVDFFFEELEAQGSSYTTGKELFDSAISEIQKLNVKQVADYIKESSKYVLYRVDNSIRVTTSKMMLLELQTIAELDRILHAENKNIPKLKEHVGEIKKLQNEQGWKFSPEQQQAIISMMKENVYMLQGLSGTGKSSAVAGFTKVATAAGMSISQCALSGKAAENLKGITGLNSSTIHSLLGFNPNGGFIHHKDNKLMVDCVILDELSMVDIRMFHSLVSAIPSGAKLIMLGDMGQLEAIGVGIMSSLIKSGRYSTALMTNIQRQALDSSIATHSFSIRKGKKPSELSMSLGRKTYGAREDLSYLFLSTDEEETIPLKAIAEYKRFRTEYNYETIDIQVLSSTRKDTSTINNYIQKLRINLGELTTPVMTVNDINGKKDEDGKPPKTTFYEGDLIINNVNSKNDHNQRVYNGEVGIVVGMREVEGEEYLLVKLRGRGDMLLSKDQVKNLSLGYSTTAHKAQGSSIKAVIVALSFNYLLNTQEWLYTAMTRAKEQCVIISSPRTIRKTISTTSVEEKRSNLYDAVYTVNPDSDFIGVVPDEIKSLIKHIRIDNKSNN